MRWPFNIKEITSPFGYRKDPFDHSKTTYHRGADAIEGPMIRPIMKGKTLPTKYSTVWGNSVLIDHGGCIKSFYAHCRITYIPAGTEVTEESILGLVGSTGRSTAAHLHFGIQVNGVWVDPVAFIKERIGLPEIIKELVIEQEGQEFYGLLIKKDGKTIALNETRELAELDKKKVDPKIDQGRVILTKSDYKTATEDIHTRLEQLNIAASNNK